MIPSMANKQTSQDKEAEKTGKTNIETRKEISEKQRNKKINKI